MIFRIALSQVDPTVGDLENNASKISGCIDKAGDHGADLVVFPAMSLCGAPLEDLARKEHFIRDAARALEAPAARTSGVTAIVGLSGTAGVSSIAVLNAGKVKRIYVPDKGSYSAGPVLSLGGMKFAVNVIDERSVAVPESIPSPDADIVFNICAIPYCVGMRDVILKSFSDTASGSGVVNCYVNLTGGQDGLVFDGGSFAVASDGKMIASGKRFAEDMVFFDIDIPVSGGSDAETLEFKDKSAGREALEPSSAGEMTRLDEMYNALVLGTRDYILKNGFSKCVLGLSGGIDSALTAAIACAALGPENVTALSMPSKFSSEGTCRDSKITAESMGIELHEMPIEDIRAAYHKDMDIVFGKDAGVAGENLQARIRGNMLMSFSNKFGAIVLATGNKSEAAMGYCTLYGDTVGGLAVICDLLKTTVYELSRYINEKAGRELIPESVIMREPSAELSAGQKDTDSLPPYDVLDPILKAYIEEHLGFEEITARFPDRDLVKKVINMFDKSEYKRRQVPPGIKLTHWALGRDRILPLTNKYREPGA